MHYEIPTLDAAAWQAISWLAEPDITVRELNQRSSTLKDMLGSPELMRRALRLLQADFDATFAQRDAEWAAMERAQEAGTAPESEPVDLRAEVTRLIKQEESARRELRCIIRDLMTEIKDLRYQDQCTGEAIYNGRTAEHPGLLVQMEDLRAEIQQLRTELEKRGRK